MGALTGRTALVTGGSRGIGRQTALRLARDGAVVAVHYGRNAEAAKETVKTIEEAGGAAFAIQALLEEADCAETLWSAFDSQVGEVAGRPGLDILVNNVSILGPATIETATRDGFLESFAINVTAPFFIIQQGLSRLRDGGRIISVSSITFRRVATEITPYSMTKGAMDVFSRTLAVELGPRHITVNSVAPAFVDTDMTAPVLSSPGGPEWAASLSVFGRTGQPSDVADIIAFLASDDARWITGQVVDASGGTAL